MADAGKISFKRISLADGLSHSNVYSVVRGKQGFIWFGTENGLNRYDGYSIKEYTHNPENPRSLSNNNAGNLFADNDGSIWIGSWGGGLDRFDPKTGVFTHHRHDPEDSRSIGEDRIQCVFVCGHGDIWAGTRSAGLNRLDRETGRFKRFSHDPDNPDSISNNRVWSIAGDNSGRLWVGTDDGLNRFDHDTETFTRFHHSPNDPKTLSHDRVRKVTVGFSGTLWVGTQAGLNRFDPETETFDRFYLNNSFIGEDNEYNKINTVIEGMNNNLWVGSANGGLYEFRIDTKRFVQYAHDPNDSESLSNNDVRSVYIDPSGIVWVGARGGGVNTFDRIPDKFRLWRNDPGDPNSLNNNMVLSIWADSDGVVWIGTEGGGINRFDRKNCRFTAYEPNPDDPGAIGSDRIRRLYRDRSGRLWAGAPNGLYLFNEQTETFDRYAHDPDDPESLGDSDVHHIFQDSRGVFWIGLYKQGLNRFDPETGKAVRYVNEPGDPKSISDNNWVRTFEDRSGNLWVGTQSGLNRFDRQSERFTRFFHDPARKDSISSSRIHAIHEDRFGNLWIGTFNGLNLWIPDTDTFERFMAKDGLASNFICAVADDESGRLWISTVKGISRFSVQERKFKTYTVDDGLQSNQFIVGSCFRGQSGELFFGGVNGLNSFFPDKIKDRDFIPPVVVTGFNKLNRPADLPVAVEYIDKITLPYNDNFFSFDFTALDYKSPQRNRYAYKLDPFDKDWIDTDASNRKAVYTNLNSGSYVFRVRGSNSDGVWNNDGASISLLITPPIWKTKSAYILYALFAGLFVLLLVRFLAARHKRGIEIRKLKWEREAAEAAAQSKSVMLANMSHEIRTPLNAVAGLTTLLEKTDLNGKQRDYMSKMNVSVRTLLGIVNDILDYSKIEVGRLELETRRFQLHDLMNQLCDMFSRTTAEKRMEMIIDIDGNTPCALVGDPFRLEQILINLTNNALKFTEIGEIRICVRTVMKTNETARLEFSISDTGIGIDPEKIPELFTSFNQADVSTSREYGGTGLGLAICKQLVNMMDGNIGVRSVSGEGSTFFFTAEFQRQPEYNEYRFSPPDSIRGRQIFIACPNENALKGLEKMVRSFSFDVLSMDTSVPVSRLVQTISCDLMLIDAGLFNSNEPDLIRMISGRNLPVVLIKDILSDNIALESNETGITAVVEKPVKKTQLFEIIVETLLPECSFAGKEIVAQSRRSGPAPNVKGSKILLAEDNVINQAVARELLESEGVRITIAGSGREALKYIENSEFDAVLMDIRMPDMDGYTATRRIRSVGRFKELPIIAMTAYSTEAERLKCLEAGMNDHIAKPIDIETVLETLAKWITSPNRDSKA